MGEDEEEKARLEAEAEARRQRVLEKSRDRMNKVAGLQEEADDEDEATKKSSAARMAAMRKRRFKKGGKGKEEAKEPAKDEAGETNAKDEAATSSKDEETATTTEAVETPATTPAGVGEKSPELKEENTDKALASTESQTAASTVPEVKEPPKDDAPKATTTPVAASEESASDEPKKKYKGVAKMRREKMLQKKKEEAAKAEDEEKTAGESPGVVARRKKKLKQPMLPIIMYIVTTFLLFLAGLDVGLQHADDSIIVNTEFSPKHFTIQKLLPWSTSAPIKNLEEESNDEYSRNLLENDEFSDPSGFDQDYVPKIDPLFRVDLDAITRGPGFFLQLARGAVKIHRMVLYVLWEMPLQMFSLPRQLFQHPPVMCLSALTIRQVLAKLILGAKLPNNIEEDVRNAKEITDVLTMIKNAVKNTVIGTFPNAVSIYEGFNHLRMDMYVVLCGVFVGLLIPTMMINNALPPATGMDYEEIIPEVPIVPDEPEPEIPAGDGIADEL